MKTSPPRSIQPYWVGSKAAKALPEANVVVAVAVSFAESLSYKRRPPLEYLVAHAAELLKLIGQHSLGEDAFVTIDDVFPQN